MTTCQILYWSPFCCQNRPDSWTSLDHWRCAVVFKSFKLRFWASMDLGLDLAVDKGQRGHLDSSAAMQPHTQQTVMHCVFWHLSIRTSLTSSDIWAIVARLLGRTRGPAFAPHVHQWTLAAHDPVAGSPLALPWTTAHRENQENLALVTLAKILALAHSSCF